MHSRVIKLTGRIKERNPSPLILHNLFPRLPHPVHECQSSLFCLVINSGYVWSSGQHKGLGKLEGGLPGKRSPSSPTVPNTGNSLRGPKDNLRPSSIPCGWILFTPLKAAWSRCKLRCRECRPDHPLIRGNQHMLDLCERCTSNGWYPVFLFRLEGA